MERIAVAFKEGDFEAALLSLSLIEDPRNVRADAILTTQPLTNDRVKANLLHLSSKNGWFGVMKLLLTSYQFDPQERDDRNHTCLHYAAAGNHVDVLKYLIKECGCDPMAFNWIGTNVLHCAAANGSFDVLKYLISDCHCDPMIADSCGENSLHYSVKHIDILKYLISECGCDPVTSRKPILHYAVALGSPLCIIKYLIDECNCDPMSVDTEELTALHWAVQGCSTDAVKYLLETGLCNLQAKDKLGLTPLQLARKNDISSILHDFNCCSAFKKGDYEAAHHLLPLVQEPKKVYTQFTFTTSICNGVEASEVNLLHLSSMHGWLDIVKDLINNYHFDPQERDNKGCSCIFYAIAGKHIDVVQYLLTECNCNPTATYDGTTILHCAAAAGLLDTVKYLIDQQCYDLLARNKWEETVLHCAVKNIDIIKYLLTKHNCNPVDTDCNGQTVLHYAASVGSITVAQYLIDEYNCDPMIADKRGWTVLHFAVHNNHTNVVRFLLSTGKCDTLAKNNNGATPLEVATTSEGSLKRMFQKFDEIKKSHQIDSYVNILLLGNSKAGKSTLSCVIKETTGGFRFTKVKGIVPETAGVISTTLQHKALGNLILHDFAGHSSYLSSHSAIIEYLLKNVEGVFLVVVDITEKNALKQIYQWLTFVKKVWRATQVIVVASHADMVNQRRKNDIQETIGREKIEIIFLDCRQRGQNKVNHFFNKLNIACKSIRDARVKKLSLYCPMMYGLIEDRKETVIAVSDMISAAKSSNFHLLPDEDEEVSNVLYLLASTGLIIFLNNLEKSWVIPVNRQILLAKVNVILFAPSSFKEHATIASNTGIIQLSVLAQHFPEYDIDMLICFLKSVELCREINYCLFKVTNLVGKNEVEQEGERLLFFPSLLTLKTPDYVTCQQYEKGWCLKCSGEHNFFPARYFHRLSLCLVEKFEESEKAITYCEFWQNGLYWFNGHHKVGVLVEIIDDNRCVCILLYCEKDCSDNLQSKVIGDVIEDVAMIYNKSCPGLEKELTNKFPTAFTRKYSLKKSTETEIDQLMNAKDRQNFVTKSQISQKNKSDVTSVFGKHNVKELTRNNTEHVYTNTQEMPDEQQFEQKERSNNLFQGKNKTGNENRAEHLDKKSFYQEQNNIWQNNELCTGVRDGPPLTSSVNVCSASCPTTDQSSIITSKAQDEIFTKSTKHTETHKEYNSKKCDLLFKDKGIQVETQDIHLYEFVGQSQEIFSNCIDKKTFSLQSDSDQVLDWSDYGLIIKVPKGALTSSAEVDIIALAGGDFAFPKDYELVSAIYAISFSKPLSKHVKLQVQHCVSIKKEVHSHYLDFAVASIDNKPSYQFKQVKGGIFSIGDRYGHILVSHFSLWSIIKRKFMNRRFRPRPNDVTPLSVTHPPPSLPPTNATSISNNDNTVSSQEFEGDLPVKHYIGQVVYQIKKPEREWLMNFLTCKDLNALKRYISKTFEDTKYEHGLQIVFNFKEVNGRLELHVDTEKCGKGWSIRPQQEPNAIDQTTIDEYSTFLPPYFPHCLFTITVTPCNDTELELNCPIELHGIESVIKKIIIVLTTSSKALVSPRPLRPLRPSRPPTPPTPSPIKIKIKSLKQVVNEHQVVLKEAFECSLSSIADQLFAIRIIPDHVLKSPTYDEIIRCFLSSLDFIDDQSELEQNCEKFLAALSNVGGPLVGAARMLKKEWKEVME